MDSDLKWGGQKRLCKITQDRYIFKYRAHCQKLFSVFRILTSLGASIKHFFKEKSQSLQSGLALSYLTISKIYLFLSKGSGRFLENIMRRDKGVGEAAARNQVIQPCPQGSTTETCIPPQRIYSQKQQELFVKMQLNTQLQQRQKQKKGALSVPHKHS